MSHEEVHTLLATYAAGTLPPLQAQAVRSHLASGCPQCLGDLFRHPVGLPRVAPQRRKLPSRRYGWLVGLALAAVLVGFGSGWFLRASRIQEGTMNALLASVRGQLERAEATGHGVTARVEALERELAEARAEAGRQQEAMAALTAARTQVERELAVAEERIATLTRGVQRRDGEIDRLLAGVDDGRAVRELMATPGLRLLPLLPPGGDGAVHGHVLWHPGREVVVVAVFDLRPLAAGATYRIAVQGEGSATAAEARIKPDTRGDLVVPIHLLQVPGNRLHARVDREPPGEVVLVGQTAAAD